VVDEAVDHRGGGHVVAEDLAPRAERLVGRDDHGCAFVAVRDEAEHEVRGFGIERDVADFVNDQDGHERQAFELGFELALAFGVAEAGDPLARGGEQHALPGEAGSDPEGGRDVGFAGPGRLGVALLMWWSLCRGGCGWSLRRARFGVWSWRCSGGGLTMARRC
jgi:hypothetical protein